MGCYISQIYISSDAINLVSLNGIESWTHVFLNGFAQCVK